MKVVYTRYDHEDSGTPFLHKDGVMRGKGKLMPVDYRPSLESGDEDFPMILSTEELSTIIMLLLKLDFLEELQLNSQKPFCKFIKRCKV